MPSGVRTYSLADPTKASEVIPKVLDHLRQPAYFRTALALYRRLQFGRFLDSSYLFTNRQLDSQPDRTDTPWFYAFVDRGCRPETEVWLFGSWEVETPSASDGSLEADKKTEDTPTDQNQAAIRILLLAFIKHIKEIGTPPSIHRPEDVLAAESQLATANHYPPNPQLPDPDIVLFGAIHSSTVPHLQSLQLLSPPLLPPNANHTFVFPLATLPPAKPLPPNLRWGKLSPEHFPLVRSRTEIARQDFTLARLPNLAIFPKDQEDSTSQDSNPAPVAWGFVGLDGSLTTLHTEKEYRRLGLGMMLSAKLFREELGRFWDGEDGMERLAHGNVLVGNEASAGMCRNLGGEDVGRVCWVCVDLERV
jgi:hypothetical protein